MTALTVATIRSLAGLEALTPAWSDLADRCGARAASYPWWCVPFLAHSARGRPLVVAVHDAGHLVALAPFYESRVGPVRLVRLAGHGQGAVGRVLVDPATPGIPAGSPRAAASAARQVGGVLLAGRRFLQASGLELTAGWADVLAGAGRAVVTEEETCPVVDTTAPFDAWWAARGKETHRIVRRSERSLVQADLRWELEVVQDRSRLLEVLPAVTALYDAAETLNPRAHLLRGRPEPFTRALLEAAGSAGRLRLFLGWVRAGPGAASLASFDIGLVGARSVSLWLGRISPDWRHISPGHLAMHGIVKQTCEAPAMDQLDLMMGGDAYKRRWQDAVYTTVLVEAARTPAWFSAGRSAVAVAGRAGRLRKAGPSTRRS